jgi:hypothetical protein
MAISKFSKSATERYFRKLFLGVPEPKLLKFELQYASIMHHGGLAFISLEREHVKDVKYDNLAFPNPRNIVTSACRIVVVMVSH